MHVAEYQLGHADDEVRRQQIQAKLMEPMTRKLLNECGMAEGQTVLDIGCGPGDVALLAAEKVGPGGQVIGIDVGAKALDVARRRAQAAGLSNVQFHEGSEVDLSQYTDFDVVIGRLVLIHQKDPVRFIKKVASKVRPGGVLAFHEHAGAAPLPCRPPALLYDDILRIITNCFQSSFNSPYAAFQMSEIFYKSGLSTPHVSSAYPVISNPSSEIFDWCALCLKAFSAMGTLKNCRYDIETISSQLRGEFSCLHTQVLGMLEFTAWAQVG